MPSNRFDLPLLPGIFVGASKGRFSSQALSIAAVCGVILVIACVFRVDKVCQGPVVARYTVQVCVCAGKRMNIIV